MFSEAGVYTVNNSPAGSGLFSGSAPSITFGDTETPTISLYGLSSMMALFYWTNSVVTKTGELSSLYSFSLLET